MLLIQNETPAKDAPEEGNSQPHIVVINHDEYDQFFISIERKLYLECTDVATAVFNLLGCHYVFNLSYNTKLTDIMRFIQEKVAQIPSTGPMRWKSAVSATHINGITSEYNELKKVQEEDFTSDSDA